MGFENLDMVKYYQDMVDSTIERAKEEMAKEEPDKKKTK